MHDQTNFTLSKGKTNVSQVVLFSGGSVVACNWFFKKISLLLYSTRCWYQLTSDAHLVILLPGTFDAIYHAYTHYCIHGWGCARGLFANKFLSLL